MSTQGLKAGKPMPSNGEAIEMVKKLGRDVEEFVKLTPEATSEMLNTALAKKPKARKRKAA